MSEPTRVVQPPDPRTLRRVVSAGFIGTTVEYYDFFIYGTAAALVFPQVFFPSLGDAAATAASFATFAVAFVARPVGGVLFGHFGDRVGRKATLVATLMIMGLSTVLIGLLPTSDTLSVAAPILLITLRFVQGLAVGGEWASAALFVGEYAPADKRGLYALSPTLGTSAGILLATLTFLVTGWSMSTETFEAWGWRIPFLFSIVLVAIGMWVRLGIADTPVFRAAMEKAVAEERRKAPLVQLFQHQWREMLLAAGVVVMWLSFFYIGSVYLTNYGKEELGHSRNTMLSINMVAIFCNIIGSIVGARLSDRVGRRRVMSGTAIFAVPWGFAIFLLADTGSLALLTVAISVTLTVVGMASGTTTALLPEIFHTSYRSTGTGVSYNLGSLLGGAIPPIIAAPLLAAFGSLALGTMMATLALISVVSALLLKETRGRSLQEPSTGEATARAASIDLSSAGGETENAPGVPGQADQLAHPADR